MELIRRQYPVGTRIILNHMDDSQAPPPGTKGTVAYVDDIGQIGVKWDTGSSRELMERGGLFARMWQNYQTSIQWKVQKEVQ